MHVVVICEVYGLNVLYSTLYVPMAHTGLIMTHCSMQL